MHTHPSGWGWHSRISHSQAKRLRVCEAPTVAMPKRRDPSMHRRTISRYRGSKMFSAIFSPEPQHHKMLFNSTSWYQRQLRHQLAHFVMSQSM